MGRRQKKLKVTKLQESSASEEDNRKVQNPIEGEVSDDDEEANEDLSLNIVRKSLLRACNKYPENDSVLSIVTDVKKEKKKRKKSTVTEVPEDVVNIVPREIDKGFRDFCGELFRVDTPKGEEKLQTDKAVEISDKAVETNPVEVSDNAIMRKPLRGPRYFDPPDNSWGACYNCGEEGHTAVNCTSARRKKPCFVCGSLEHNAKLGSKGRDCFICKQQGHRSKDCPEKYKSLKICLNCGDLGHDMLLCRNDYCPEDLKEIQCYVCHRFGHLCCADYGDPKQKEVSCYRCGRSGHTGLACTGGRSDSNGTVCSNSCYKCGGEGHFARECFNSGKTALFTRESPGSKKVSKRIRDPSTPKQKSFKKIREHKEVNFAPHDFDKTRKNKKPQNREFASASKTNHRGGWIPDDPHYCYNSVPESNNWRSPGTPSDRRSKIRSSYDDDYASNSHSRNAQRFNNYNNYALNRSPVSNYASNKSSGFYQHSYSASRFGNHSNGMKRDYDW